MKFNDSDKKYIIKRVIIFLIITFISYFIFSGCAKASVQTVSKDQTIHSGNLWTVILQGQLGKGLGQGYVIGNVFINPNATYNYGVKEIFATVVDNNGQYDMLCEIGSTVGYTDSQSQYNNYTYKCPVDLNANAYVRYIGIRMIASGSESLYHSTYCTYTNDSGEASVIVSGINSAINNMNQQSQTNSQAIQSAINSSMQQQITVINNASSQAHQDSQAINNSINSVDSDDESANCGIICKLKSIVSFLKPSNLIYLVVPSQQDWQDLFNDAIYTMRNKLGVLGLVMSIFLNFFATLIGTYSPNYCFEWQALQVPNFEQYIIIPAGSWCIDTYFQDGVLKTFHDTMYILVGGLIVFAFIHHRE